MTVRHHLQFLQREGLVRAPQTVRRAAPGRPRFAYQLSPKAAADTPKEFAALAGRHPELCKMDLELITRVTGADVKRVCHAPQGDATCSYLIMPAIGAVQAAG